MKPKPRCPCQLCQQHSPSDEDFCACGYPFAHPGLDKSQRRRCVNCGREAPR